MLSWPKGCQVGVKTANYMFADDRWSGPQSGTQFMASDCLQDEEVCGIYDCHSSSLITSL
jgi:hypothetical protein